MYKRKLWSPEEYKGATTSELMAEFDSIEANWTKGYLITELSGKGLSIVKSVTYEIDRVHRLGWELSKSNTY